MIEPGYLDYKGDWTEVPEETLDAIARVMGEGAGIEPRVRVVRQGEPLGLPDGVTIELEDGRTTPAGDVPLGYHRILGDGEPVRLIVAPPRCFLPEGLRVWGWAIQLYALRSRKSWGIGDAADLARFGRAAGRAGARVTLINPLHASSPTLPQEASPYFPGSRTFRNPLYISIDGLPGAGEVSAIEELAAKGRALNDDRRIDRDEVFRLKIGALETLWERFPGDPEFDRYQEEMGPALEGFATWTALAENNEGPWREWDPALRHPTSPAVARFARENYGRVRFHAWVQWLLDRQLAAAAEATGIVNDLAIGVQPDGADAWLWQDALATGSSVGAPPDDYTTDGQHWGVLGFDPRALQEAAYEPFIQVVRASMRHAAGVRFDHVMGLWRLFWIPDGIAPKDGGYVRYPAGDLLDILALESHRAQAFVVGEDLGTVEEIVREEMRQRDMLSYKLLWFEERPPSEYPYLSLAAPNNHDLPTTAGLWTGSDELVARELGVEPNEGFRNGIFARLERNAGSPRGASLTDVVDRSYEVLARAPSAVVLGAIEDALEVTERQNQPGTTGEQNWSTALPVPLEDIESSERVSELARVLDQGRSDAG
jgi:4-alpha-glucanotransferase